RSEVRRRDRAHPPLPALPLAAAAAPVQIPPHLLGVRGAGDRDLWHPQRYGAGGLAPVALQPLQPRRLRPRLGSDPVPVALTPVTLFLARALRLKPAPAADRLLRVGPEVLPRLGGDPVGLVDRPAHRPGPGDPAAADVQ